MKPVQLGEHGASLVEVMVTLALMSLLMTAFAASVETGATSSRLEGASREKGMVFDFLAGVSAPPGANTGGAVGGETLPTGCASTVAVAASMTWAVVCRRRSTSPTALPARMRE